MNPILLKRLFHVTSNRALAPDIYELTLAPADAEQAFTFKAGQWVYLFLLNEDGSEWARAAFSIASAPSMKDGVVQLAIKVYKDYTKRGQALKVGDAVRLQGPFGVFVPKEGTESLVMFGGGIGVTPFMSMIREALHQDAQRDVVLIYANRTREEISYEQELRELQRLHPRLRVVFILTRENPEGWDGETRRIDAKMITDVVKDVTSASYFACGPVEFMDAAKATLETLGVDVKKQFHKELFN